MDRSDSRRDHFTACLLAGAIGDALGAPVEFMSRQAIVAAHGPAGITDYAPAYGRIGAITDDTQMTLFTAEGLLRAFVRRRMRGISSPSGMVGAAYQRWLLTQGETNAQLDFQSAVSGWLFGVRELHSRRAPGNTCLSALRSAKSFGAVAVNHSKGCGGVMRVAPVGLMMWRFGSGLEQSFDLACEVCALTHGHPTGQLTGGVLAAMIHGLLDDRSMSVALDDAIAILVTRPQHEQTSSALSLARSLADERLDPVSAIARLGQGWIAEEALAIAVYCALVAEDFRHGLQIAVNHDGDSDSTGAIVGHLLGARDGLAALPDALIAPLELREVITQVACDLFDCHDWDIGEYSESGQNAIVWERYPGG
ncbi:ADP-ribosylglycohydrolase family protein [soil metagenome]